LMSTMLSRQGHRIDLAEDGVQAVAAVARETYDVVLMDVQMPELDGIETVKAIRVQERFKHLPVVAMTAHAMLGDRERFLECGMSDYISKPIEEEQLLAVLAKWIEVAPPPVVADAPAEVPQVLPGLNVSDGVRRASGNRDLYRRLLAEFKKDLDEALPQLGDMLGRNAAREATDLLHSLKGCAATLGAKRVSDQAAALEIRLRRGEIIDTTELGRAIEEAKASIDRVNVGRVSDPAGRGTAPAYVQAAMLPIAKKLDERLSENNLDAAAVFEELKRAAGSRHDLRALEQSLDALDFEAARAHLKRLEAELE
jgi:two-component system sensor histidine kinase/response regulator